MKIVNHRRTIENCRTVDDASKERGLVQTGSYSYTAADGTPIAVNWVVHENGFQATGAMQTIVFLIIIRRMWSTESCSAIRLQSYNKTNTHIKIYNIKNQKL